MSLFVLFKIKEWCFILIKRCKHRTCFYIPVTFKKNNYSTFWYYDDENTLFRAFYQLKYLKFDFLKVGYPIVEQQLSFDDVLGIW